MIQKRHTQILFKLDFLKCFLSCDYTWKNYNVTRREDFSKVSNDDISYFEDLLPNRVIIDENELEMYNTDWLKLVRGMSKVLLRPKTTEEVSNIVKYCNQRTLALCPQGGNTGLVGGSVPVFDEIILSFSLMNQVNSIDPVSGTVVCQSGIVLEKLDNYLYEHGLMVPLDLGAKGSCFIGGNVSTNAGGLRFLRYGSLHSSVLGVEAVLADGTILDCLSTLKKDNTGYDLKQLFIGSEGTLGLVTGVSLACPPRPKSVNLALLGINSFEEIQNVYLAAKSMLGEILSAFEFFDQSCALSVHENLKLRIPIPEFPFYVLVETSGSNFEHDTEKLNTFLDYIMDKKIVLDGTLATEPSKIKELWEIRENIAVALLLDGDGCFKYDISLPVNSLYNIVNILKEKFSNRTKRIVGYGHFGDGNLHLNVVAPTYDKELLSQIEPIIFEYTALHKGSISAEHGIGFKKSKHMHYSRSNGAITLMRNLKNLMDPKGILNPYKVIPKL
ncbi:D-2-hydroxyglutarate dehydrogenase, mitochondrial-like isoform X1 [Hydra vulgaris]|uniref:D-2-hydroxyglutarate dehydrogenase, mitochondrial n=2 Tax=Hydra vulgaris TaxID=6087 RepID=A0ABM4BVS0_HYDVU